MRKIVGPPPASPPWQTALILGLQPAFPTWQSALWYCLRAARGPADALLIFRAAQLSLFQRRAHLTMASTPWKAALDAQDQVADQAEELLAYVDPLIAALGALALQTGFSVSSLQTLTTAQVCDGAVPSLAGFDAGQMHRWIAPLVEAQSYAGDRYKRRCQSHPLLIRSRTKGQRSSGSGDPPTAVVTEDRIVATLRTLETERDLTFDHSTWAGQHGITAMAI